MSAADATIVLSAERAALRAALRRGDALTAARAWEKLRVAAQSVSVRERVAGQDARKAVGRAIRDARYRRLQSAMDALSKPASAPAAEAAARSRLRPLLVAIAVLGIAAILIGLQTLRPVEEDYAPAAAAPAEVVIPTVVPTPNTGGRGRTNETPQPVVVVTPAPVVTPQPTAEPTASAAASGKAPGATQAAGAQPGGQAGGVTGGVPGGTVGGTVGGVVGGTGTKTLPPATPTPYVLPRNPPQLPPGADRFLFRVIDQATGLPLAGVCVNYGFPVCGPQDPHTNDTGLYWLDLNPGMATSWNFRFALDGYLTATLNKTYKPGMGTSTTTVFLRHQ